MGTTVRSFKVRASLEDIVSFLSEKQEFSSVYRRVFNDTKVAVLVGEKFFFRTGSWAGITIVIKEESPESCVIDAIGFAGGEGLLKISWFSEEDYVEDLIIALKGKYPVED